MPKLSDLSLLSVLVVLLSLPAMGCTPNFRGPGEFTPGGVYRPGGIPSPYGYKPSKRITRGEYGPLELSWPVDKIKITQHFGNPRNPRHQGLDLDGHKNDPIYSAHPGVVVYTGSGFSGYGKMVLIEFDDEWATLYAHLNSISVHEGDEVNAGELIGRMGRTGRATGVHLHFELIRSKQPVNPIRYLPQEARYAEN